MSDFREGDLVSLRARVVRTDDYGCVLVAMEPDGAEMTARPDRLELIERPGPRLADLPDGTVIEADTGHWPNRPTPYMKLGHGLTALVDINEEHGYLINDWAWPFDVLGASPGTDAWPLYAAALRDTEGVPEDINPDWWRTA